MGIVEAGEMLDTLNDILLLIDESLSANDTNKATTKTHEGLSKIKLYKERLDVS